MCYCLYYRAFLADGLIDMEVQPFAHRTRRTAAAWETQYCLAMSWCPADLDLQSKTAQQCNFFIINQFETTCVLRTRDVSGATLDETVTLPHPRQQSNDAKCSLAAFTLRRYQHVSPWHSVRIPCHICTLLLVRSYRVLTN